MIQQMRRIVFACLFAIVLLAGALALASCRDEPSAVSSQSLEPVLFTFQDGVTAVANGSRMDVTQLSKVGVQVEGISSATVTFSATIDGSTWYAVEAINRNTGAKSTATTADGIFDLSVGEFAELRCQISSYSSGTITVVGIGLDGGFAPPADIEVSSITTGTVNIGDISGGVQTNDVKVTLDSEAVVLGAGETHIGEVGYSADWITLTLSLDTGVYAANEVLADTQTLASAMRVNGGSGWLSSLTVLDEDDQGGDLTVVFLRADVSLGTENSAISITDADARQIMCTLPVLSSDYTDLVNSQVASLTNSGCELESASDSTSIYVGVLSNDAKTYTATGIQLGFGIEQN